MQLNMENVTAFAFVLSRMTGCIFFNPFFSRQGVPNTVKVSLSLTLALVLFMWVPFEPPIILTTLEYLLLLFKELAIGLVMGQIISFFGLIIVLGGEIIDFQIGIAMAKVFDPTANMQISLSASFYNIVYMLLFVGANGHITLVKLFMNTAKVIPFGNVVLGKDIAQYMVDIFCDVTVLAIKFAMPIIAIAILVEVGVGILMKLIPQINVFVLNIQIKLIIGYMTLALIYYPMVSFLEKAIVMLFEAVEASVHFLA